MSPEPSLDISIGKMISQTGWQQGSLFYPEEIIPLPFEFDSDLEVLAIVTQSCSIVSPRDPIVEAMAAKKIVDYHENSFQATGKDQRKLHLRLIGKTSEFQALEFDINRRIFFNREKLLLISPIKDMSIGESSIKQLATWIARSYTRIALPDLLVENMRGKFFSILEKVLKSLKSQINSIYIAWQQPQPDCFSMRLFFLCESQTSADGLEKKLLQNLDTFIHSPGTDCIHITELRCGTQHDTFLADLNGYERFSQWDYLSQHGEISRLIDLGNSPSKLL